MPGMFGADPIFTPTFGPRVAATSARSGAGVISELLGGAMPAAPGARSSVRPGAVGGVAASPAESSAGLVVAGAVGLAVAGGLAAYLATRPSKPRRRVRR